MGTTTWTLVLILAAAVAMLLARTQHLEHLVGDPLWKEPSTQAVPPAVQVPAQLEANLTDVAARLQQLKERAVAPLAEAVSLLLACVQHVERLVEDPPEKEPSTQATPAGPLAPTRLDVDLADLAARLRQLEENAASPPAAASRLPTPRPHAAILPGH